MAERLKAAVLKTVRPQKGLVGSNPTPSAILGGGARHATDGENPLGTWPPNTSQQTAIDSPNPTQNLRKKSNTI